MVCFPKTIAEALEEAGLLIEADLPQGTVEIPEETVGIPQGAITGISFDNRQVKPGFLFVCKGAAFRREYLFSALEKGALLYMAEERYAGYVDAPCLIVRDIRLAMAIAARVFYGEEARPVRKVGITGTKGKTTVSVLLSEILDDYTAKQGCRRNAHISSLSVYDGEREEKAQLTTPEAIPLWQRLAAAGRNHLPFAVCEVSSQALKYHRVSGIDFEAVAFLNIGEDHISDREHPNFEDYFASKLKIFENAKTACVFSGAEYFEKIHKKALSCGCSLITFGWRKEDDLFCSEAEFSETGCEFTVFFAGEEHRFSLPLPGRYNLANALGALALAYALNIPPTSMAAGLARASVPGRGRCFTTRDRSLSVLVDYAHNKMSLEALLDLADEQFPGKKKVLVFGCPGGKAKNRRRDMGLVAGERVDHVILTEDDPGPEEAEDICREIAPYVTLGGADCQILLPRADAIAAAFSLLEKEGGLILVCGKGCETEQKMAYGAVYYEGDEAVVAHCLDACEAGSRVEKEAVSL